MIGSRAARHSSLSCSLSAVLPPDLIVVICSYDDSLYEAKTHELLRYVVLGKEEKAEKCVSECSALLNEKGTVTDMSLREFVEITAFQYVLWSLDWHMWKILLKYMCLEEAAKQIRELDKEEEQEEEKETGQTEEEQKMGREQCNNSQQENNEREEGTEDKDGGALVRRRREGSGYGKQFNFKPLFHALQCYIKNYKIWSAEKCLEYWCKVVGKQQLLLPMHVVNEYCRPDRSFSPCPSFTEPSLPRIRAFCYGNSTRAETDWFWRGSFLGEKCAVFRSILPVGAASGVYIVENGVVSRNETHLTRDLNALQSLMKTRQQQRLLLTRELAYFYPCAHNRPLILLLRECAELITDMPKLMKNAFQCKVMSLLVKRNDVDTIRSLSEIDRSAFTYFLATELSQHAVSLAEGEEADEEVNRAINAFFGRVNQAAQLIPAAQTGSEPVVLVIAETKSEPEAVERKNSFWSERKPLAVILSFAVFFSIVRYRLLQS